MATYVKTPTITAGAYSAGDILGGDFTLPGALDNRALFAHVSVFDDAGVKARIDFFIFDAALSGTYTDNAAFAIDAADKANLRGVISVLASDYIDAGSDAVATIDPKRLLLNRVSGGNLGIVPVLPSVATYSATDDLRFEFGLLE